MCRYTLGSFFAFVAIVAVFCAANWVAQSSAQQPPAAQEVSQSLGVNAGVYAGGQAAFWDLHLIDHFRYFGPPERVRGHKPEQPVKFSHVTHVQKKQIECQFCHWTVAKSPYAAIPEVETCDGCHKMVGGTDKWQQDEIQKVKDAAKNNSPIAWQKVHVMPDYLRFNHKRHVKAGVACHECHGQVPEMDVVERVSSMKMGWCVGCHREKGVSIDCYTCHH